MLDKDYLKKAVSNSFPDLINTEFVFNKSKVQKFTESVLLPFLVYQNTTDTNHRLIGLFLSESSIGKHLVPFYIILSQYRKALEAVMKRKDFQNTSFRLGEKQVVNSHGDICSIVSVDFINREIIIRAGGGKEMKVRFFENYTLRYSYNNALDVKHKIESFDIIDKAEHGNIFTFPISPEEKNYEGVIIFTSVSKFESLLRNIKVSGSNLKEYLNIEKVIFLSDNESLKFKRMSGNKTSKKPVSVIIARHDAYKAYFGILGAAGDRLKHIRTIIIDDFDVLMGKWEKSDKISEELEWLKENYFSGLRNRIIKDIYLISRNSKLEIHESFKQNRVDYYPWLLKPIEVNTLDDANQTVLDPLITVTNVADSKYETLLNDLNLLINRWKLLAQNSFCNGEILSPINCLFEFRRKLDSFLNPEKTKEFAKSYLDNLEQLRQRWFSGGQDHNLIHETIYFIHHHFFSSPEILNFKLEFLRVQIKNDNVPHAVTIISENNSTDDIEWMRQVLSHEYETTTFAYCNKKDFPPLRDKISPEPAVIYYLTTDKNLIGIASGNFLAVNQVFILHNRAYSFAANYFTKYQQLQNEAGERSVKYKLLNLQGPTNPPVIQPPDLIRIRFEKKESNAIPKNEIPKRESELQEIIEEVLHLHKPSAKTTGDNYLLLFDDGSITQLPESKNVFLYEDDKDSDDIERIFKSVSELKAEDQIILPRRGLDVKDLLGRLLMQNPAFKDVIETDERWRILVRNYINKNRIDLTYFRQKLRQNGFIIGTDNTIKNWIDGETRRPDNFESLLNALHMMGVLRRDEIKTFDKCNSELKAIQIRFIRTAIHKLLSKLNGIHVEEDTVFTDDLLNGFIDHIEIKRIQSLHKL